MLPTPRSGAAEGVGEACLDEEPELVAGSYLPLNANLAVGNFLRDALGGGPLQINGDGTPYRSYLYAADLAVWLWTILFRGVSCRPYNVGSDRDLTIAELARQVVAVVAPAAGIRIAKTPDPSRSPLRYVPATLRARDEFRLLVKTSLPDALRRTATWCRQQALARSSQGATK